MLEYIDSSLKDITESRKDSDEYGSPQDRIVHRIVTGEEERVRVVSKNPDNLLVSWVLGGMTLTWSSAPQANKMLKLSSLGIIFGD